MSRILIVDDESNIRLMLRLALQADGHQTSAATDGPEALDLYGDGQNFDLVLLDQRMPGMEGLEVLKAMRKRNSNAKIIMATAFGTVDLARDAMKAGASGFLRKPFTTDVLRAAVGDALSGQTFTEPSTANFNAVSVNGFRLEALSDESSIAHHQFRIYAPNATPADCAVELPPFFVELVKAHCDRENLENDPDFWLWLSEEALANYLWQNAAPPASGVLVVDELTSNLKRWMEAVLAA